MVGFTRTLSAAALCAAMLVTCPAWAGVHAQIVEFGETTAESEQPAPDTQRDKGVVARTEIEGVRYVNHNSVLPAQLCLRFGVTIRVVADQGDEPPRELTVVVSHPLLTRPDGASGSQESFPAPVNGDTVYVGWRFDHSWEVRPGDWTFTFLSEGEELVAKTFTLIAPPSPGSICPSPPTS